MNLDQDFFQVSKLREDFTRNGTLFLSTDLRSDAHQSQIIGGDADEDHAQIVGGYTVKLLGGYIQWCKVTKYFYLSRLLK